MEVVVTTSAIRRANLQSKCHHQRTNVQLFTDRMPFLSPNQQCQSTDGKLILNPGLVKTCNGSSIKLIYCQCVKCSAHCSGALVVTGGFIIFCIVDCRHSDILLVCVTMATGCHGLQYLSAMAMPLELSRRNAANVGALSLAIANIVKFAASFAVRHVAQLVSPAASTSFYFSGPSKNWHPQMYL